jgi:hypothetical protein
MKPFKNSYIERYRLPISQALRIVQQKKRNFNENLKQLCNCPFTISEWYGRVGNNVQQISLGIMYAKKNRGRFISPDHELIKQIFFNFPAYLTAFPKRRSRFYTFIGTEATPDVPLEYEYIKNHIYETVQEYIKPNLKVSKLEPLGNDFLVIHLRGGDIFIPDQTHRDYVQNPLSFYLELIPKFKKTLIVAEPGERNPVLDVLKANYPVIIQSTSVAEDFATLMRATHLATSGVGTFAIAAAMCSTNLQNFYCSDQYLREHLNPEMLGQKIKIQTTLLPEYIKPGEWNLSQQMIEKLMTYKIR